VNSDENYENYVAVRLSIPIPSYHSLGFTTEKSVGEAEKDTFLKKMADEQPSFPDFISHSFYQMSLSVIPYILYADDDPDDQELFTEVLSHLPIDVKPHMFDNGLHLLQHLDMLPKSYPDPAVVVLDMNMPVMNGVLTLETIRHDKRFKDTPVVIFTTSTSPSDKQKCIQLGANAFFSKPIYKNDFRIIADELMNFLD
jgi:CheY-like chemotaxis protein